MSESEQKTSYKNTRPDVFRKRLREGFTKFAVGKGQFVNGQRIARIRAFYHPQGRIVTMELPEFASSSERRYGQPFIEEYDSAEFQEHTYYNRILLEAPSSLEQLVSEHFGCDLEPSKACEYPSIRLANKLEQAGYVIADASGKRNYWPDKDMIEVLQPRSARYLGIEMLLKANIVGRYYLNNEDLRAQQDSRWVLEVYGRVHLQKLQRIGREVGFFYGVPCKANVVDDQPLKSKYRVKAKKAVV